MDDETDDLDDAIGRDDGGDGPRRSRKSFVGEDAMEEKHGGEFDDGERNTISDFGSETELAIDQGQLVGLRWRWVWRALPV